MTKNVWYRKNPDLEILDGILTYLEPLEESVELYNVTSGVSVAIQDKNPLKNTLLTNALLKLYKDGYVYIDHKQSVFPDWGVVAYYRITFTGLFFIRNGGYSTERHKTIEERERILALEKQNRFLSFVISVGTSIAGLYYLLEILKHWSEFAHALTT